MDGLSQDEINALLAGMNLSEDDESVTIGSDEEIESESGNTIQDLADAESLLSEVEKDAIGEVGNISMGSSATTLYSLVNRKVNITTPVVEFCKWENLLTQYERPCVFIQIKYTVGLDGTNILILKEQDVKIITDLMMGGDGTNTDVELGELHLSAISEAMNQMMGASATSLSTMLQTKIDISPPSATLLDLTKVEEGGDISPFLGGLFVKIAFRMQIDDLVDSSIMQLYPVEFARRVVNTFISSQSGGGSTGASAQSSTPVADAQAANPSISEQTSVGTAPGSMNAMGMQTPGAMDSQMMGMNPQMGMMNQQMGMMNPQMGMQMPGAMDSQMMGMNPQMGMMNPQMGMMNPQMGMMNQQMGMMNPQMMQGNMGMTTGAMMQNVNAQPAQFQSFTGDGRGIAGQENIGIIRDVPLEVTVELGRTSKSISEILNFAPGTIIELDRIAGEPIDVLVNGKFVAKGEVVVIEESFSVRVTDIIK